MPRSLVPLCLTAVLRSPLYARYVRVVAVTCARTARSFSPVLHHAGDRVASARPTRWRALCSRRHDFTRHSRLCIAEHAMLCAAFSMHIAGWVIPAVHRDRAIARYVVHRVGSLRAGARWSECAHLRAMDSRPALRCPNGPLVSDDGREWLPCSPRAVGVGVPCVPPAYAIVHVRSHALLTICS